MAQLSTPPQKVVMMPTYTMINKETGEEKEMVLSLSEREEFLSKDTHSQKLSTAKFISQTGSTLSKTSNGWKEVLSRVKSGAGKDNSIND